MAFQYTNMVSVQLLLCFTIPCVLVLSFFLLKMRFTVTHIIGCVVATGGLTLHILLHADGAMSTTDGPNVVKGDLLTLLAAALYGTTNVLAEWFIKPQKKKGTTSPNVAEGVGVENGAENNVPDAGVRERDLTSPVMDQRLDAEQAERLPVVPKFIPLVETLCCMSGCALVFATIQFFAVEWRTFSVGRSTWTGEDWFYQMMFGVSMLVLYTGMQSLFLMTSAAFANISLLATSLYGIIWEIFFFGAFFTPVFFASYAIIISGVLMYNLSDVHWGWCPDANYICGEPRVVRVLDETPSTEPDACGEPRVVTDDKGEEECAARVAGTKGLNAQ